MDPKHLLQLQILQQLMYSDGLRYSEMKEKDMEGSLFTFHLDQLVKEGFISKESQKYVLTEKGKEFANRMDLGDTIVHQQAKVSVMLVCTRGYGPALEYLLYTRRKNPFFGYQGFPTGKVKYGEDIVEGAKRELLEETNLIGEPEVRFVRHYVIKNSTDELLEDKVYFVCLIKDPIGELQSGPEGEYAWIKKNEVWDYLKKPVQEVAEVFKSIEGSVFGLKEVTYQTDEF